MNNGSYINCQMLTSIGMGNALDIEDMTLAPNSHFIYTAGRLIDPYAYYIMVERNSLDAAPQYVGKCIMMGFNMTFVLPADEMCASVSIPNEVTGSNFNWYAADIYKGFISRN